MLFQTVLGYVEARVKEGKWSGKQIKRWHDVTKVMQRRNYVNAQGLWKNGGKFSQEQFIRVCWRHQEAGEINKGEMSNEK